MNTASIPKTPGWPATSPVHYLTAWTALNIPSPEGTGDWHFAETFEGVFGRPPGPFCIAGLNTRDTTSLLGVEGVFDARERLERYGLALPPGPVYAADHYRALADWWLDAVVRGYALEFDLHLRDWLPEAGEQRQLRRLLAKARPSLSFAQWQRIHDGFMAAGDAVTVTPQIR